MLVGIGRAPAATDLLGSLRACHARIRHFGALAAKLAAAGDAPAAQIRDAASEVRRYFVEALPLHVADEEQTLAPLLRGREPALDEALDRMAREHGGHEAPLAKLVALCERLERAPEERSALEAELAGVVGPLRADLEEHLAAEESVVLPAIGRLLGPDEQARARAAMAARRSPTPRPSGGAA
jgi:iron-sulfur cluster repair protein YtfE (RIC family)